MMSDEPVIIHPVVAAGGTIEFLKEPPLTPCCRCGKPTDDVALTDTAGNNVMAICQACFARALRGSFLTRLWCRLMRRLKR